MKSLQKHLSLKTVHWGTSIMVQWLRLQCSQCRGPQVQSLVGKLDPTCEIMSSHAATKT